MSDATIEPHQCPVNRLLQWVKREQLVCGFNRGLVVASSGLVIQQLFKCAERYRIQSTLFAEQPVFEGLFANANAFEQFPAI